jgi:hypothetical protein
MHLRTAFGIVTLRVWRGKSPTDGTWAIPIRQRWGLSPHQQLSPALEDKLAYFATVAATYESAAQLARKMGISIEDSTVRQLVQRLGARAEEQTLQRLKTVPSSFEAKGPPSGLAVIMVDGYQVRHRGPDWGKKKAPKPRVEWHEQKVGVFYHQEQNAEGTLLEKVTVGWQGQAVELENDFIGKLADTVWAGRGTSWPWATERHGFGGWSDNVGKMHINCWTFITPASTCTRWQKRRIPRMSRFAKTGWISSATI